MEKLFVLAGKAGSGKDTIASIIKNENSSKKVIIYSCTMYLKKYIMQISGWSGSEKDKPRDLLQKLGKEIKEIFPDYFLERMDEDIRFLSEYCDIMIVTGVRLKKELDFLKEKFDGILIKVESEDRNNLTDEQKKDITEVDVDDYSKFDYVIFNDFSESNLRDKVIDMLKEV